MKTFFAPIALILIALVMAPAFAGKPKEFKGIIRVNEYDDNDLPISLFLEMEDADYFIELGPKFNQLKAHVDRDVMITGELVQKDGETELRVHQFKLVPEED